MGTGALACTGISLHLRLLLLVPTQGLPLTQISKKIINHFGEMTDELHDHLQGKKSWSSMRVSDRI